MERDFVKIVAKVGAALQLLFGQIVDSAHAAAPVVLRRAVLHACVASRCCLGFLKPLLPMRTWPKWRPNGARCHAAGDQAATRAHATCLEELIRRAIKVVVESEQTLAPLLERVTSVTLLDSSVITLPNSEKERFPGCGGSYDPSQAALKLQTELNFHNGGLGTSKSSRGRVRTGLRPDSRRSFPADRCGSPTWVISIFPHSLSS